MEKEPLPLREKLRVAAAIDYPAASEILVSFPDRWELVHQMWREDTPLYIAAMPPSHEQPQRDHFFGLPSEINFSLSTYRHYKFFYPWPTPEIIVGWNEMTGTGRVTGMGHFKIHFKPLGDAQVWYGETFGVLWECFFGQAAQATPTWQDELATFWQAVEKDMGVSKVFTQPHEPTFERGYTDFLGQLGYAQDPDYPKWWSKAIG